MNAEAIAKILEANIVSSNNHNALDVNKAFASDLMSDVLTLNDDNILLITGLSNMQTIRTAEMSDIGLIILTRNKKAGHEMIETANKIGVVIIECRYSMYKTCGLLYEKGIQAIY